MPFGEIVIGSPGSGKSTYAYGKYQLLMALNRKCIVVNLDPANDPTPYPSAISLSELITLQDAMDELGLGPNGGMLYCMEYLEQNFDWLEGRLKEELERSSNENTASPATSSGKPDTWVIFDLPGQVELSTNHNSLKAIVDKLSKVGYRLAAVHLCDAHYVTDTAKYVSVLLLSLRTMFHMGLPHINVLSKLDLLSKYGELGTLMYAVFSEYPFNLTKHQVQTSILTSTLKSKIFRTSRTLFRPPIHAIRLSQWRYVTWWKILV
ncbi:hypothetical protein FRC02_002812 [Tulasnella sp. 418]|nr:hypothetical protein FRC02_002812 [Tulasnella sp. 418]